MNLIYNISKEAEEHLETRGEVYTILNNVQARLVHLFPDINKVEIIENIEDSHRIFLLKVNNRPFLDYKLKLDKTQDYLWTQVISDLFTMAIGKFGSAKRLDAGLQLGETVKKEG